MPISVPQIINGAKERIARKMPQVQNLSIPDMIAILAIYNAGVAVNFTDWIGKTMRRAQSKIGLKALGENLDCEMEDEHVEMLNHFSAQCGAMPGQNDYRYIAENARLIRALFRDRATAGLAGMTVLALLENTSEIFIPVLAAMGKRLDVKDFTYTDVHGAADVEHSQALAKALDEELHYYTLNRRDRQPSGEEIVERATALTVEFICNIFLARAMNR